MENIENNEPKRLESGFMVDILIPPECMDEDGGKCEHDRKPVKKQENPV